MPAAADPASGLEIAALRQVFLDGQLSAAELLDRVLARLAQSDDPALWISRIDDAAINERARQLDSLAKAEPGLVSRLPLFGIPFAVKDNIDVAGMPTTAACPAFAYTPEQSAPVVERLTAAGAVLLGKTNLDQFATGLVGTRSPYGVPKNAFDPRYIPGGSSSGSAVAVSMGLVSFALGTDTAGSGRVPAAFNSIIGLKPSRGIISTKGVVPACRSLDCVSIFTLTAGDAAAVLAVAANLDPADPLGRASPAGAAKSFGRHFRFGIPRTQELEFFGDHDAEELFQAAIRRLEKAGGTVADIDMGPFYEAGRMLFDGPWVAERLEAAGSLLDRQPEALLPVTRAIIERGRSYSALDAFRAQHELASLRHRAEGQLASIDCLLLPTTGTIYEVAAVAADPVGLNNNLGRYTNFANLMDLSALAVPAGFRKNGLPFGISLVAPAFCENALVDLGARLEALGDSPG